MIIDGDGLCLLLIMTLAIFGLGVCAGMWIVCKEDRDKLKEENEKLKDTIEQKEKPKEDKVYML